MRIVALRPDDRALLLQVAQFYEKLGYAVVGVLPDANGVGKPDIFMAKRVRR